MIVKAQPVNHLVHRLTPCLKVLAVQPPYPPLWAKEPPVKERSRRPVPVAELWGMRFDGQHSVS
jgi:hypothetical protein